MCVVAWVVSAWVLVLYARPERRLAIALRSGRALFIKDDGSSFPIDGLIVEQEEYPRLEWKPECDWGPMFACGALPLWIPTLLTAIPSVLLWRAHLRRRRRAGDCPVCGYSLAGLAPGAACPECGRGSVA